MSKKGAGSMLGVNVHSNNKNENSQMILSSENGPNVKTQLPKVVLKPETGSSKPNEKSLKNAYRPSPEATIQWRPLKLVYGDDIRLAQMLVNCSFRVMREIVSKRFPSSKSILIKYKDNDGDLVTITCTDELKMAEACVDSLVPKDPECDIVDFGGMLRLHIVEVNPEQEPTIVKKRRNP